MQNEINLIRHRGGGGSGKEEGGPNAGRLKPASWEILKYEKVPLPVRLMMDSWNGTTLFNGFSDCLIGIPNFIY